MRQMRDNRDMAGTMTMRRSVRVSMLAFMVVMGVALVAPFVRAGDVPGADAADDGPSDVVVLTKDNYESFVKEHPVSLVEYYAPWCGHCKRLKPEYEKAATELLKDKPSVPLAKIDCTAEREICEKENVPGFPTLKVFRDGVASEFKGERNAKSIVDVMKRQLLPAVSVLEKDKLKAFVDSARVVIVGLFDEAAAAQKEVFSKIANSLRDDFTFGTVSDAAAFSSDLKVSKSPAVVLYKKFDEGFNVYEGDFSAEDLKSFISEKSIPVMDEIGPQNYQVYIERNLPIAFFFYGTPDQREKHGKDFEAVAKKHVGKISFVYLDASKFGGHATNLALKEEWPAFAIQNRLEKYPFDQTKELTLEAIGEFTQSVLDGKLKPTLKSEEVPAKQEGPVTVVVGKNFNSIVRDVEKDVFIEFYAPWCGHCKKLAPIWDELGEKFSSFSDKIVIAKMDATVNDVPPETELEIQGFPTLVLVTAVDNKLHVFNGDRSLGGLISFVKATAHHKDSFKDIEVKEEKKEDDDEDREEL